ncbi:MAG: hypothetical protein ACOZAA_02740, partial [Pseudomonadota bacterium]
MKTILAVLAMVASIVATGAAQTQIREPASLGGPFLAERDGSIRFGEGALAYRIIAEEFEVDAKAAG